MWSIFSKRSVGNDTKTSPNVYTISPSLVMAGCHICGIDGEYWCTKAMNLKFGGDQYQISPRFGSGDDMHSWMDRVVSPYGALGRRRAAFLESLCRNAQRYRVEGLFCYVRDMLDYFEGCTDPVMHDLVSVQYVTQATDLGDALSDCMGAVRNELFPSAEWQEFSVLPVRLCGVDEGALPAHVGHTYAEPLRMFFRFSLLNVDVGDMEAR